MSPRVFLALDSGVTLLCVMPGSPWQLIGTPMSSELCAQAKSAFHRGVITATTPDGTLWALDVSITATPGPEGTVHAHLER